jgi:hypothetical protein
VRSITLADTKSDGHAYAFAIPVTASVTDATRVSGTGNGYRDSGDSRPDGLRYAEIGV